MSVDARIIERTDQLAMAQRVLGGESLSTVAQTYGIGRERVRSIVQMVCLHLNPDVYCDELKARIKRERYFWDVKPSLAWLRTQRAAFGWQEDA